MIRTYADHKASQFGVTYAQWVVLARLDRFEGLKQSELAEMLDLQPITLTRLLDRLCDSGLIERRADPNDRRAKRLYLTPAAGPIIERLGELGEELMATALAGVERESRRKNGRAACDREGKPAPGDPTEEPPSAAGETALWLNGRSNPSRPPARSAGCARGATGRAGAARVGQARAVRQRAKAWRFDRKLWVRRGLFGLLPLALLIGGIWYVTGGQIMSTDNAYVNAETVGISTDVAGIVKEVDVHENQHVSAGQILYRLDPLQFQIALDNAKANLAQTALTIEFDEAGLQAHAERCRRTAGAGRSGSDELQSRRACF